jgi:hypothetical protein
MDITILAAWGEFIGGIAVVVSLVYLASQIRMILDPDAASLYVRGMEDFVGLSTEDRLRFNGLISHLFGMTLNAQHLRRHGLFDADMEKNMETSIVYILESPGARQWWTANRHWWQLEFRDFVDGLIREGEAAG